MLNTCSAVKTTSCAWGALARKCPWLEPHGSLHAQQINFQENHLLITEINVTSMIKSINLTRRLLHTHGLLQSHVLVHALFLPLERTFSSIFSWQITRTLVFMWPEEVLEVAVLIPQGRVDLFLLLECFVRNVTVAVSYLFSLWGNLDLFALCSVIGFVAFPFCLSPCPYELYIHYICW